MLTLLTLLVSMPTAPSAEEVIGRVLAERAKIRSWHVTGSYRYNDRRPEPANHAFQFELWREGEKARTDRRPLGPEPTRGWKLGEREVTCVGCWPTDGRAVWARFPTHMVEHIAPPFPTTRGHADKVGIDIRKFGLLSDSIIGHPSRPIDKVLREHPLAVGSPVVADGTIVLTGTHPKHGFTRRLTVDPARGYCVTAIDGSGVMPGSDPPIRWRQRTRITPARDPASGLWYVRESAFEELRDDAPSHELTVTLDTVELNRPLDPKAFSLGGLGIPVGFMVSSVDDPFPRYWDGAKVADKPPLDRVVVYTPPPAPPEPVEPPRAGWSGWLAPGLAVGFAGAAVVLLRRAVRRRAG